jgi:uncharacterized protein (DUF433 family)
MHLDEYFDVLAPDDIRIKGHRIGIESVLYEYLYRERTPEEIAARFPTLALDEIYATILYYLRNEDRVRAYMAAWIEHGVEQRERQQRHPTAVIRRLRQHRAEADVADLQPTSTPSP